MASRVFWMSPVPALTLCSPHAEEHSQNLALLPSTAARYWAPNALACRGGRGPSGGRTAMVQGAPVSKAEGALPPADRRAAELGCAARSGGPEVIGEPGWPLCCSAGSPRGVLSPAGQGGRAVPLQLVTHSSGWVPCPLQVMQNIVES